MTPLTPSSQQFLETQQSPEFKDLRSTFRKFTFPMGIAFFVWYLLYVIVAIYAPGFMSTSVMGNINVGILFGVLQFVTTFIITWAYVKFADREIEPRTRALRAEMEYAALNNVTVAEARAALSANPAGTAGSAGSAHGNAVKAPSSHPEVV